MEAPFADNKIAVRSPVVTYVHRLNLLRFTRRCRVKQRLLFFRQEKAGVTADCICAAITKQALGCTVLFNHLAMFVPFDEGDRTLLDQHAGTRLPFV